MRAPHLLVPLAAALLFAAGASATPITPNTDLSGTVHDGENHSGVNATNSNITLASFVGTNLSSGTLRNVTATGADFTGANLTGTNLRDGSFTGALFDGAAMTGNLRGADFSGASFLGTNLGSATNWNLATWTGASYDATTVLPAGMDPAAVGMLVGEPQTAALLGLGLIGLGLYGRPRHS